MWIWIKRGLAGLVVLALLGAAGFVVWATIPAGDVMPRAQDALQRDSEVSITERGWLAFIPNDDLPTTGYILYPGARVPAEAYAPMARRIAEAGYLVVIVYPPLNLSIFNNNLAAPVIDFYSAVDNWVVGGHSLGGSSAAIYALAHPDEVDGLVLLASRPINDDLTTSSLPVISLYGTRDGINTVEEARASRDALPPDAQFIQIEGGNHSQFGYYGLQSGDQPATISREAQQAQIIDATLDLLARVSRTTNP